jgi:hypothetical protein
MIEYDEKTIKEMQNTLEFDDMDSARTEIQGFRVTINRDLFDNDYDDFDDDIDEEEIKETITPQRIKFAFDLLNDYLKNKEKYENAALETIKNCLNEEDNVDDSTILEQLGKPSISITNKNYACLNYGEIKEIGHHYPELRIERNDTEFEIYDIALNG